jgi:hypothetical protein
MAANELDLDGDRFGHVQNLKYAGKIQRRPIRPAFAAQPSSKQPKVKVLQVNNRPIPGH